MQMFLIISTTPTYDTRLAKKPILDNEKRIIEK